MTELEKRPLLRRIVDDIALYLLWAIIIVLAIWCLLRLRAVINMVWILVTLNRWTLRAVDRFSLLGLGIAWLAGIILAEAALREAMERGKMYILFAKIAGAMAAAGGLLELFLWLMPKLAPSLLT